VLGVSEAGNPDDGQQTDCAFPTKKEVAFVCAVVTRVGAGGTGDRDTFHGRDASLALLNCCCGCTVNVACDANAGDKDLRTCGPRRDNVVVLVNNSSFFCAAEKTVLPVVGREVHAPTSAVAGNCRVGVDTAIFDVESGADVGTFRL